MPDTIRVIDRPLHGLHAAERASDDGQPAIDTEHVRQTRLCLHPIANSHDGKIRAKPFSILRIVAHRPGTAMAAAQIIEADHEKSVGVDDFTWADQIVPPTRALIARVVARGMVVAYVFTRNRAGPFTKQRPPS